MYEDLPSTIPSENRLAQGAEAVIFRIKIFPERDCILKYRPKKRYRLPELDARLRCNRCLSEARLLERARRADICVPSVYLCDIRRGSLFLEYIDGECVRSLLARIFSTQDFGDPAEGEKWIVFQLMKLMRKIGRTIGQLHLAGIVHGDLTTSNILLRHQKGDDVILPSPNNTNPYHSAFEAEKFDVVLIDFGLGQTSALIEDKAVDLYVLERAFSSTISNWESLFLIFMEGYESLSPHLTSVSKRLQEVRRRGRKKIVEA